MFFWSLKSIVPFNVSKNAMISALLLAVPYYTIPLIVETNVSGTGVRAVVMQKGSPLAYLTENLNERQQSLSTYEKELLALIMATHKWYTY